MRVILAGGGTAGHINPAVSIADTIKKHYPDSQFLFVGTERGMESRLVPASGYKIEFVDVQGLRRKISADNIRAVIKAFNAVNKCKKMIKKFKPDIVIGTGGYVSGPVLYAASALGIPTLIHEQNVFAGMTSRMLSKRVDTVCISFEKSRERFSEAKKIILTGNPIRENLFDITYENARNRLKIDNKPFIVVFGGSLGAERINNSMVEFIRKMPDNRYRILFATGEREFDRVSEKLKDVNKNGVEVVKYIYNMNEAMQAADLLVCRAGAITVSEIGAMGKASVLIPSPNVTDNHQFFNAKALSDIGAAVLIEEKELDDDLFFETVSALADDAEKLKTMGRKAEKTGIKNASALILKEIEGLINAAR